MTFESGFKIFQIHKSRNGYVSIFDILLVNVAETSENFYFCFEVRKRNIGLKQAKTQFFASLFSLPIFFNGCIFKFSQIEKI